MISHVTELTASFSRQALGAVGGRALIASQTDPVSPVVTGVVALAAVQWHTESAAVSAIVVLQAHHPEAENNRASPVLAHVHRLPSEGVADSQISGDGKQVHKLIPVESGWEEVIIIVYFNK